MQKAKTDLETAKRNNQLNVITEQNESTMRETDALKMKITEIDQ